MADEGMIPLEPEQPPRPEARPIPPGGGSSMGSARPARAGSLAPGAKIEAGGLLDDFDEDADFSEPPSPANRPAPSGSAPRVDPASAWEPIVTDASSGAVLGSPKAVGIAGGVLLLAAVVVTAISTASGRPLVPPLITLYEGVVHTGTGVVAVLIAARFAERRVNRVELVAARMLVVVSLFLAIKNSSIPIPGRVEEHLLAAGAYYLGVMGLFRLPRFETGLIAGTHFCLWVLMLIGRLMYEVDLKPVAAAGG